MLNGATTAFNSTGSGFFVRPVRQASAPAYLLYEPSTGEVTYDIGGRRRLSEEEDWEARFQALEEKHEARIRELESKLEALLRR